MTSLGLLAALYGTAVVIGVVGFLRAGWRPLRVIPALAILLGLLYLYFLVVDPQLAEP
jgi:hypothetical protein